MNILKAGDERDGVVLKDEQVLQVLDSSESEVSKIVLPSVTVLPVPPLEVIDGQHRLAAFDESAPDDFELPVVAFHGLGISWQAYLFWTINIKPKRISASLAYDLYPLLRSQEWLQTNDPLHVYRETRAQELTEVLWSTPSSPWFRRINMLGASRRVDAPVTQAAFVRSLTASLLRPWDTHKASGGLFGGSKSGSGLEWSRLQQAAFLLEAWRLLAHAIEHEDTPALEGLRAQSSNIPGLWVEAQTADAAFTSKFSLLATDQGVRGFQSVVNDICYMHWRYHETGRWQLPASLAGAELTGPDVVEKAAESLQEHPFHKLLDSIARTLASYDWRTSAFPGLSDEDRRFKAAFRGSGGYKELREHLLKHLASQDEQIFGEPVQLLRDQR